MSARTLQEKRGVSGMEKAAAGVLSALVIAALTWIASSVQQSQLQYARIEERLNAQASTLLQIQKSIDASSRQFDELDRRIRSHDTRLTILEQQIEKKEKP